MHDKRKHEGRLRGGRKMKRRKKTWNKGGRGIVWRKMQRVMQGEALAPLTSLFMAGREARGEQNTTLAETGLLQCVFT